MGCIAKNGESINDKVRDMGFDDKPERIEEDGKFGYICPKCKTKCWTMPVGNEGWVCECVECDLLFDED